MWKNQLRKEDSIPDLIAQHAPGTRVTFHGVETDDDKCCEMIKKKFRGEMQIVSHASGQDMPPDRLTCDVLQHILETASIQEKERGKKYGFDPNDTNKFFATTLLKEWDECAKSSESWKNELR